MTIICDYDDLYIIGIDQLCSTMGIFVPGYFLFFDSWIMICYSLHLESVGDGLQGRA
jgi:hypothetical protein